jgi:Tfp pilus assembly protein PilO
MASSFRDWPWPLQAMLYLVLAFVMVAAGLFVPGSPVRGVRIDVENAQADLKPLEQDVSRLRLYKQRRAELQSDMDALQKQLATLQTIVPEEKEADQFMLMVQRAAISSGVSLRQLTAKPVASKQYYFEMPFDVAADGPYYGVLDFFAQLGRLSRIMNVGDLKLGSIRGSNGTASSKFTLTPGTSVTGTFTIITFFTKGGGSQPTGPQTAAPRR